jgi:hypothetical protein
MRLIPTAVLAASAMLGGIGEAAADLPRHERITSSPIKDRATGEIIGVQVKMLLRRASYSHDRILVGLGKIEGGLPFGKHRAQASDPAQGYLLHQWPAVTGTRESPAKEVVLKVLYKDNPKLVPGKKVDVVTAWAYDSGAFHVWGMQSVVKDANYVVTLPGTPRATGTAKWITNPVVDTLRAEHKKTTSPKPTLSRTNSQLAGRKPVVRTRR